MKVWMESMSDVTRLMRSPVRRGVVVGERELLHVGVQVAAQVVRHPLADAGRKVLVAVGEDGVQQGDDHDAGAGQQQTGGEGRCPPCGHDLVQPAVGLAVADHIVQNDLQRPWLQNVRSTFTKDAGEPEPELAAVRPQQAHDCHAAFAAGELGSIRRYFDCVIDGLRSVGVVLVLQVKLAPDVGAELLASYVPALVAYDTRYPLRSCRCLIACGIKTVCRTLRHDGRKKLRPVDAACAGVFAGNHNAGTRVEHGASKGTVSPRT